MTQEYSKEFLQDLMSYPSRTVYAKIVQSNTGDEIIGVVTGGSINVDGASAARRTCSLSLTTEDIELSIDELNWVFKTRFSLSIGLKNELKFKYSNYTEDIIWFPQGEYIITSFSNALSTNAYNISISGQDKMCLLNGEVAGILSTQVNFGSIDIEDEETGDFITQEYELEEIIRNIVHIYAGEPLDNIVIDLPTERAYDLIEYMGNKPLYLLMEEKKNENNESFSPPQYKTANVTIQQNQVDNKGNKISELPTYFTPANRLSEEGIKPGAEFWLGEQQYYVDKVDYKEVAGYKKTELVYAGELIGKAGETLTSVLDKIKNVLGEYEYFFGLDGKFYFQKKPIQIQKINTNIWDNTELEQEEEAPYAYEFEDLSLFTSFNNSPNIKNLKNDFTVWGSKKSVTGSNLPIHMRIVIDKKPEEYVSPFQEKDEEGNIKYKIYSTDTYDWRELIYQMAKDYFKNNKTDSDYYDKLYKANSSWVIPLTITGDKVTDAQTGYETYYSDMLAFWRDLYNPSPEDSYSSSYFNNQSSDLYINPWESKTPESYKDVDKWYIEKEIDTEDNKCYIRWIDSLDLSPKEGEYTGEGDINSISLKQLYYYNSIQDRYEPILQQDFGDLKGPVYIKYPPTSGDDPQVFDSYVVENILEQKGINPENLFWKQHSTNNFTPFIKRYNIKDLTKTQFDHMTTGGLLNSFYLKKDREGTLVKIYGVSNSESSDTMIDVNWDNILMIQNAQIIFYQEVDKASEIKKCEPHQEIVLQAYDFKFQYGEEDEKNDYSLFINNNGRYLPLLEYLILDKYNVGNSYLEQVKYTIDDKVIFWSGNVDPSNNWKELGLEQNLEHIGDFWQQLNEQGEIENEWVWIQSERIEDINEIVYNIPNDDVVTFVGWNSKRLYSKAEDITNRIAIFYYYDNDIWNSFKGNFASFANYTKISKDKKYHIESLQLAYHWGYYETEDRWTWFRGNSYNNKFSYEWYEIKIPTLIKQNSNIFISKPSNYNRNDLWILNEDSSINGKSYMAGTILIANQASFEYDEAHWGEKTFLDEFSIYAKKDDKFISLISQTSINRDALKAQKKNEDGEFVFVPFYELESIPENTLYIKNKEVFKALEPNDPRPQFETFYPTDWQGNLKTEFEKFRVINYYTKDQKYVISNNVDTKHWSKNVFEEPQNLNFWIDFTDDEGLEKYSIQEIGRRPLVKPSESNITAIAYFNDPNAYFNQLGMQIPEQYEKYFIISSRGLSALERIKELLYNHTYVTESITVNSIPLYHLEPNSKIRVNKKLKETDEDCYADYYVDKISIPLTYNGTMSINATKAPPKTNNNKEETTV